MKRAAGRLGVVVLGMVLAACAAARPSPRPRPATEADKLTVGRALLPLVVVSGLWRGPADGCVAALGIVPTDAINLGVGPHPTCKLALLITEGALQTLSPEELQAALAHEIGHVELGHFAARQARRQTERATDQNIGSAGAVGSAAGGLIPGVGPIVAVGVMGAQMIAQLTSKGAYRAYDRGEEAAADRFALDLLDKVHPGRCRALIDLFARMQQQSNQPLWTSWLGTHPSVGSRLDDARAACQAP